MAADHPTPPDMTAPLLVGRERERTVMRQHLDAALIGRGGLALVGGEAGIGKTALAESICREAAGRGALVLTGRCFDLAETPPYGPWLYLFGRYRPASGMPPLPDAFARRGMIGGIASQTALFMQLQDFFEAVGERQPMVLLLDDYHWADLASLDLLRFLAQSVSTLPLLLIVTYRVDELTRRHPLYALLPTLVREADALRLDLKRLDTNAVRAVVEVRYPLADAETTRLVAYLHERTEGNPFFLGELLRMLEEENVLRAAGDGWLLGDLSRARVPALLRQVIEGRLARLGDEAQQALAVAAVTGQEIRFDLWAAIVGDDEEALLAAMEQATEARLVEATPSGSAFRFVHALIRETLYEGMQPLRRRIQHRKIAETLATSPKPDPDVVAYHFQQAGDARAVEWLIAAGDRAERAYAYLTAAERFEAALVAMEGQDADPAQQGWLLLRLAVLRRYADARRSITYLEAAAPLIAAADDPALSAYITLIRGLARCFIGNARSGVDDLEAGTRQIAALPAERVPELLPPSLVVTLDGDRSGISLLVLWLSHSGRYVHARRLGEALVAPIPPKDAGSAGGHVPHGDNHSGLAQAYAALGLPDHAREAYARARQDYDAVGNLVTGGNATIFAIRYVEAPYFSDDIAARHRLEDEVESTWRRASDTHGRQDHRLARLSSFAIEGDWASVRETVQQMRTGTSPGHILRPFTRDILGSVAWWQGDTELAWALVDEALPEGPATEPGDCRFAVTITCIRCAADLSLDSGDPATARAWIAMHDRWLTWSDAVHGLSEGQALWAQYYRQAGDATRAYEHAERALAHASDPRQPLALLAAHRLLGELDTETRRFTDAQTHFDAAHALADACQAPYERALTALALAELRAATGDTAAATTLLDEVRAICTPLGAKPALARADALTTRLAATPTTAPAFPAGLSAREVEVLRLVVAGHTNRDIADALFLSEHTVRVHVRNILTKTDTDNRAAATAFALRHGLA